MDFRIPIIVWEGLPMVMVGVLSAAHDTLAKILPSCKTYHYYLTLFLSLSPLFFLSCLLYIIVFVVR